MKIIKRNGSEAEFDSGKILNAIQKANINVEEKFRMTDLQIERITERKWCSMFLVDTADNKILGIRICMLNDETYETIYDVLQTMLKYPYFNTKKMPFV